MAKASGRLGVGLSAIVGAGLASYLATRRSVPSWSGVLRVESGDLSGPVEVLRDRFGIPAIFAENEADLFFAQGYLHASDRLFQLDLYRRLGTGRLAEVVGEPGLGSDRFMRTLGFGAQAVAELDVVSAETRTILEHYARGVNRFIATAGRRLPLEFRVLRYRPEPWRPEHSLVFARLLAFGLCGNWESELTRAEIAERFGTDVLATIDDDAGAREFPPEIDVSILGTLTGAAHAITSMTTGGAGTGSNNWVIGPRRTRSHGALLANDPHLDLNMPSIWYENLLSCPTFRVRGFSVPGTPCVTLGTNGDIAWGFTNSCADVQDLYVEQIDVDADTYADVDGPGQLEHRIEQIRIKGTDPVNHLVRSTRRGPIITDAVDSQVATPLSLRWDCVRPNRLLDGIIAVNRAKDWEDFRAGSALWSAPSQNAVYADRHGNIGYQMTGEIPIRKKSNGTMPRRGDDPDGEWIGTIPFEGLPSAFNPERGRIVTANDRIVADDYPYFISAEWMNGYRAERIRALIDDSDYHTVTRQTRIQTDLHSIPGAELRDLVMELEPEPQTAAGRRLRDTLATWDGELSVGSPGGEAYRLTLRALHVHVFGFLGGLRDAFLGYSHTGAGGYWALYGRSTPRILRDMRAGDLTLLELGQRVAAEHGAVLHTSHDEDDEPDGDLGRWQPSPDWPTALAHALDRAGLWLERREDEHHGAPSRAHARLERGRRGTRLLRRWASANRIRFQHPLGVVAVLAPLVNRGPYPIGGDPDTVWQAAHFDNPQNDAAMVGPSHRIVWDLHDLDNSVAVLAGGQSGHPASPNYSDQIPLWRRGATRPAPWTREAIDRITTFRQRFEPK